MSDTPSSRRAATAVNRDAARVAFEHPKSLTAGKAAAPAAKNARNRGKIFLLHHNLKFRRYAETEKHPGGG